MNHIGILDRSESQLLASQHLVGDYLGGLLAALGLHYIVRRTHRGCGSVGDCSGIGAQRAKVHSLGLAAFPALLILAAFIFPFKYFPFKYFEVVGSPFFCMLLCFLAAMSGICLTGDLFSLFVFFER